MDASETSETRFSHPGNPDDHIVVRVSPNAPLLLKGIGPSPERARTGRRRHASATRAPGSPIVVRIPPNRPVVLKGVEPSPGRRRFERDEGSVNQWRREHRATSRRSHSIRVPGYVKPRRTGDASTRDRIPAAHTRRCRLGVAWAEVGRSSRACACGRAEWYPRG